MDKIVEIINQNFNDEFDYIKTLDVLYDQRAMACTISFLYPQTVSEISKAQKEAIHTLLSNELDLNAKLYLKFRKSFLDLDIIHSQISSFFKKNYSSLASIIGPEDINITIQGQFVDILIKVSSEYLSSFNSVKILQELDKHMQKYFWAEFSYHFEEGRVLNSKEIEEQVDAEKIKKIGDIQFLPRYKVFDISKIFGQEISPEPEFLDNIKEPKDSVILAGTIENLVENKYNRIKNGKQVEKTYFKFTLREKTNTRLSCVYFCSKTNYDKMKKLVDGDEILTIVDIQKDYKTLSGKVKSLSLCQIPEKIVVQDIKSPKEFGAILPEKIITTSQKNLFLKDTQYDNNVGSHTFVVFDVETTGLDAETCEIIEIGAVKVVNGIFSEKFQTLIKPKQKISYLITDITGITNEMVETCPPSEHAIKDFYLFAKGAILSGYNVGFDMKFINKAAEEVGLRFDNEVQDVMAMARQKVRVGNYKLSTVVKALDIELIDAHRAYNDAYATAKVLLKLSEINNDENKQIE